MSPKTVLAFLLPLTVYAIGRPYYECGEHGRFEYCIDDIPGCVVGCHCHPGYYFDTNTKICEPNAKLASEYRRLYTGNEPTRLQIHSVTPSFYEHKENTSTNIDDSQVEAIAKDGDDLGDWLYNQFFKTIEGQIINKTNEEGRTKASPTSSVKKPTRRAGSRKGKSKSSSRKSKKKGSGLRRKLLRITEDDSLFDSSSSASSRSSDSDSSRSDSSGSDDSHDDKKSSDDRHPDDKEHGHRKIVVFNKKPKPPLPSFIFLPNYDTPFFPPMGLLPPPPLPMFPMIPVPPVPMPPMPFPVPPPNEDVTTGAPDTTTAAATTTLEPSSVSTMEPDQPSTTEPKKEPDPPNEPGDDQNKEPARQGLRKKHKLRPFLRARMRLPPSNNMGSMKRQRKFPKIPRTFFKQDFNAESPLMEEVIPQDIHVGMETNPGDGSPLVDNVDFKYLAQLIHRFDNNMTNTINTKNNAYIDMIQPLRKQYNNKNELQAPFHRNFNGRRLLNGPDDSYYAKLGQQIATLIRKIDTTGERDLNMEIAHNARIADHSNPVFNENSYARRSYWERYVRSPLRDLSSIDEEVVTQNYENLLSIESKVENLANTANPLSLRELENVVYLMENAKSRLEYKIENLKKKKINLSNVNINLQPHVHDFIPKIPKKRYEYLRKMVTKKIMEKTKKPNNFSNYENELHFNNIRNIRGYILHNFKVLPNYPEQSYKNETHTANIQMSSKKNDNTHAPSKISLKINEAQNVHENPATVKKSWNPHSPDQIIESHDSYTPLISPVAKQTLVNYQVKKAQPTYPKYYFDSNNDYQTEPLVQAPIVKKFVKPRGPSYFHHEIHHFDYFD